MPVGIRGAGPVEGDGGGALNADWGTADAAAADADTDAEAVADIDNGSSGSIARGGCSGGLGRL